MVIRNERTHRNMTQEQLAEKAGLHWTYISGIERGKRNASFTILLKIATALGMRMRKLVIVRALSDRTESAKS